MGKLYREFFRFSGFFKFFIIVNFIGGGNRVPRETHQAAASHWQTLSHNVASSTPHH